MTESQAVTKLVQKLNEFGFFWKASDKFRAGIPDVIGVTDSRFMAIEVKVDYNAPTALQVYTMLQIVKNDGYAGVVTYSNKTKQWWIRGTAYDLSGVVKHIITTSIGTANDIE